MIEMMVTIGKGRDEDMMYASLAREEARAYGHSALETPENLKEEIDETYSTMIVSVDSAISERD